MSFNSAKLFETLDGQERRFGSGAFLFHQGDTVGNLFRIVEGEVQLIRHQKTGEAIILQRAQRGDVLAEASVFAGTYHCDAITRAEATVQVVPRERFLAYFRQDADFAESWAARLAREVQRIRLQNEILALKTVRERLDTWLAWHGDLPPKGEWMQLARQIGVSPEALYREIGKRRSRS